MEDQITGVSPTRAEHRVSTTPPLDVPENSSIVPDRPDVRKVEAPTRIESEPRVKEPLSKEELAQTLHKVNLTFDLFEIEAKFEIDESDKRVVITLRNTRTGKVIRQIPPEEFMSNFRGFRNGLGLLFNGSF